MYLNEYALRFSLSDESSIALNEEEVLIKQDLGMLHLPSGYIVANDPMVFFETDSFLRSVPSGAYPVSIFVHHNQRNNDRRVALAAIYFNRQKPVNWEMALTSPKQDISTLEEEGFFGYGVDSGTGGFMDKRSAEHLSALPPEALEQLTLKTFIELMDKSYVDTYSVVNHTLEGTDGLNLIAFSSGYGDGGYPSYFGIDAKGEACCLVTDFFLLDEENSDT